MRDQLGRTPLHYAAMNGNVKTAESLNEHAQYERGVAGTENLVH